MKKQKLNRGLKNFTFALLLLLAFSSCTKTDSKSQDANKNLIPFNAAVMTNGYDHYITLVGLEQGIFKENGLDVKMTEYGRGINTIDAVVTGTADIGNMATYATVNRLGNTLHATNLVIVSELSSGGIQTGGLYVAPEFANNLSKLDGCKGFISILGTVSDYQTSMAIEYLGFDESEQNIIPADSPSTCIALVQQNAASAIITDGTQGARIEKLGWVLAIPAQDLHLTGGAQWLSTREYVDANAQTLSLFLKAAQQSFDYISAHTEEVAKFLEGKIGINATDFVTNWKTVTNRIGLSENGIQEIEAMEKWAFNHGRFDEDYSIRSFLDDRALSLVFPERVTVNK